jgi:uncharacterized protein
MSICNIGQAMEKSFFSSESEKKLFEIWNKDTRIETVFLHGSAVRGEMRKDSDLDLALLLSIGSKFSGLEKLQLSGQLEILLGNRIDLGILSNQNLVYSKEAIWNGFRIYDRHPRKTDARINLLLSMYYQYKEDVKEVLNAYRIR